MMDDDEFPPVGPDTPMALLNELILLMGEKLAAEEPDSPDYAGLQVQYAQMRWLRYRRQRDEPSPGPDAADLAAVIRYSGAVLANPDADDDERNRARSYQDVALVEQARITDDVAADVDAD